MHARVTRFDVSVEDIEKLNTYFTGTVVPIYSELDGYKGALSFSDRATGKWESITFWDSEAAMQASEESAIQLRQNAKRDFNLGEMTLEYFEVESDQRETVEPFAARQPEREAEATRP